MFILICGLPNSGKTTYSQNFSNVIHLDEVEPFNGSYTLGLYESIKSKKDVTVEGVFIRASERKQLLKNYVFDDKKKCIWLKTPLEECIKREDRNRGTALIKNCDSLFQPPTYEEGWDEIVELIP